VTSWSDNAARAVGLDKLPEHDLRYEMADEYLSLVYKYVLRLLPRGNISLSGG
jgi:alkanesulfonate monooxygenase SsuD/methylene tetrahydromethanopterin reductase-like flavin-dependent oxidoreductase (luciferase family)